MPRIRKRTSRRGTTNQREKIKHKAAETRKKRKKQVKKNPQWKSKHSKDPGIPSNFPYKDQILAEVAEQRRQAEEEKQRRKDAKKAAKSGAISGAEPSDVSLAVETQGAGSSNPDPTQVVETDEAPVLINPDLPHLQAVLEIADVVIEVLDARDPLAYRSSHIEELVERKEGQKLVFLLNKIDTCPQETIRSWLSALRAERPTFLFRSASSFLPNAELSGKGKGRADDATGLGQLLSYLTSCADELNRDQPPVVAVVGLTNVGKSSFINSLLRQNLLPTYSSSLTPQDGPSTTPHAQEVTLDISEKEFRLIDTPGISWLPNLDDGAESIEQIRARDILLRSKGRIDRLKDPIPVVTQIVSRANKEDLMLFYNIPIFLDGDAEAFLAGVARSNNLLKKDGAPDLAGASRIVLRDWGVGKLPRYTVPNTNQTVAPASLDSQDEAILSNLTPRKELRRTSGLVKLKSGQIDPRRVNLELCWTGGKEDISSSSEDSEEDEDEPVDETSSQEEHDSEGSDDDGGQDEDIDESEGEEVLSPNGKRKRGPVKPTTRPTKKVTFAIEPKSKQQRGTASAVKPVTKLKSQKLQPKVVNPKPQKKPTTPSNAQPRATPKVANSSAKARHESKGDEELYDFKNFF